MLIYALVWLKAISVRPIAVYTYHTHDLKTSSDLISCCEIAQKIIWFLSWATNTKKMQFNSEAHKKPQNMCISGVTFCSGTACPTAFFTHTLCSSKTLQRLRGHMMTQHQGAGGMSEPTEGACQAYARSWCETHAPQGASANDNNDWPAGVRSTGAGRGDGGRRGEDLK